MSANNEIRKIVNSSIPKDIEKKIKELSKRVDNIKKDIKQSDDKFIRQKKIDLNFAKNALDKQKKIKAGKVAITMDRETFYVKSDYLKKLKNPENYLKGLYGRELRRHQKKEIQEVLQGKSTGSLRGLTSKLDSLNQKSLVSQKQLDQIESNEYNTLEQMFGVDYSKMKRKAKEDKEENYVPIISSGGREIAITFISKG